jgi:antitoxin (DNA-binding transcriptional repressor) of toxin-antitoxin stability system
MKTLTVEEATSGLAQWVERALAGEHIQIRLGDGVVELRPANPTQLEAQEPLTPREALHRLQEDARLTSEQAERYLCEVREERLATECSRGS